MHAKAVNESVARKAGTPSILRQKSAMDEHTSSETIEQPTSEHPSVTVIHHEELPTYSSERFYMISEIEHKAHSNVFLCDYRTDDTDETGPRSDGDAAGEEPGQSEKNDESTEASSPIYLILYFLVRPDNECSVKELTEDFLSEQIKQVEKLSDGKAKIYVVCDMLVASCATSEEDDDTRQRKYRTQVATAESLARETSQLLRKRIEGVTVGVSDHTRAAPGLEATLETVTYGANARRRATTKKRGNQRMGKSNIGLVAPEPNDLLGVEGGAADADAVQGVLQCRICAEWGGNGNLTSFAKRAQVDWCRLYGVKMEEEIPAHRRVSRVYRRSNGKSDPLGSFLSFAMMAILAWAWMRMMQDGEFAEFWSRVFEKAAGHE